MWKLLQSVMIGLIVWMIYAQLGRIFWLLPLALMTFAAINATTVWILRARPASVERQIRRWPIEKYVRLVCFFSGDQIPGGDGSTDTGRTQLLQTRRDFQTAAHRAKQFVRGHESIIDEMLVKTHENHALQRRKRSTRREGALASFLLVGDEGIGKRYLTRVLARLMYRDGAIEMFDGAKVTVATLIGDQSGEGELLSSVNARPDCIVFVEHIEQSTPDVQDVLSEVIQHGKLGSTHCDRETSFSNALIVMSTTSCTRDFSTFLDVQFSNAEWQQRALAALAQETPLDHKLLGSLTGIFALSKPTDETRAEVYALLMKQECKAHDIELAHVDPEILATLVVQYDDANGFGLAPQQVKRLLRQPLIAASDAGQQLLSLRVQGPATSTPQSFER